MFKKNLRFSSIMLIVITLVGCIACGLTACKNTSESSSENIKAEKDKKNRSITIINDTNQVIHDVYIYVGEGSEIAHEEKPKENNIVIKIDEAFENYDSFTITLFDRYNLKYEKQISNVKKEGRTEVKITKDDYVEQDGDWKKKVDKWFNND